MRRAFDRFAEGTACAVGTPLAFSLATLCVVLWASVGLIVGFSDTYQLVINTATTIITFLVVFLIQSTVNRDTRAMHLKLDELLRATREARTDLIDLEHDRPERLGQVQQEMRGAREAEQQ